VRKVLLRANITKQRIDLAMRQNSHKCAIADSIKAADADIVWASATRDFIEFGRASDEMRYKFRTSIEVKQFISDFDNDRAPKPFSLVLTHEDLISMRPRQMHQAQVAVAVARREVVAKATGRPLRQVTQADVEEYERATGESTVFEVIGAGTPRVRTRGARKSKTATTGTPRTRLNNYRPTLRDVLASVGEV